MLLVLQQNMLLGEAPTLVPVPDVVGQTQAAGTATLEGDLFAVAVTTAYSSTVPAGTIISQSPAAGLEYPEGSTVTITVSIGEQAVQDGAGGMWYWAERTRRERERAKRRQKEIEEEASQIDDGQAREIARLMREQEEREAEKAELARLQRLADQYSGRKADVNGPMNLPRKVSAALINAQEVRSRAALLQLQRELATMMEEEDAAVTSLLMLLD